MNLMPKISASLFPFALILAASGLLFFGLQRLSPVTTPTRTVAAYATDLAQRTPHQRFNARRRRQRLMEQPSLRGRCFRLTALYADGVPTEAT